MKPTAADKTYIGFRPTVEFRRRLAAYAEAREISLTTAIILIVNEALKENNS